MWHGKSTGALGTRRLQTICRDFYEIRGLGRVHAKPPPWLTPTTKQWNVGDTAPVSAHVFINALPLFDGKTTHDASPGGWGKLLESSLIGVKLLLLSHFSSSPLADATGWSSCCWPMMVEYVEFPG
jgi:hypothetical protein